MVTYGPIHVHRFRGWFRCVWTPMRDRVIQLHGIGMADTASIAIGRAYSHAKEQGWVVP